MIQCDCIKYNKYYSAFFCLLEATFKIHLAQKSEGALWIDMTPLLKTIVFNNFEINILITGCLFTTSTIKWQWNVYFTAYSNRSAVKPFKPVLMIFFCFMRAVILSETSRRQCVINNATARKKESVHIESSDISEYIRAWKIYLHIKK